MELPERPKPHRPEARRGDERQKALVDLLPIALGEEEAARFLKALERRCEGTVTRLADLRSRT